MFGVLGYSMGIKMNEFTKEELKRLKIIIAAIIRNQQHQTNLIILKKLQSIIDNYCEHDGEIGKDYPAEKCMKCGKYWE